MNDPDAPAQRAFELIYTSAEITIDLHGGRTTLWGARQDLPAAESAPNTARVVAFLRWGAPCAEVNLRWEKPNVFADA